MLGQRASSVLEGDRVVSIRVRVDGTSIGEIASLRELPLRKTDGSLVKLSQVADIVETPGQLELRREDLRQNVAATARLEGRDLGSAMTEIRSKLGADASLPPGMVEFGGLYQQQQESFRNLLLVLMMAILLVFTVLLIEFGSFREPVAIVFGAVLALFGTIVALWLTDTSLNVVSFLGAIIGVGIVAKNGILMLDLVDHLRADGLSLEEALVRSGRRRLRPVLMTSLAAALGMLPLAYGIGYRRRHAQAPGDRGHRRAVFLRTVVARRHPGRLPAARPRRVSASAASPLADYPTRRGTASLGHSFEPSGVRGPPDEKCSHLS